MLDSRARYLGEFALREQVVATAANADVRSVSTVDQIIAVAAPDSVGTVPSLEDIVPAAPADAIRTVPALDDVIPRRPNDHIRTIAARQESEVRLPVSGTAVDDAVPDEHRRRLTITHRHIADERACCAAHVARR